MVSIWVDKRVPETNRGRAECARSEDLRSAGFAFWTLGLRTLKLGLRVDPKTCVRVGLRILDRTRFRS